MESLLRHGSGSVERNAEVGMKWRTWRLVVTGHALGEGGVEFGMADVKRRGVEVHVDVMVLVVNLGTIRLYGNWHFLDTFADLILAGMQGLSRCGGGGTVIVHADFERLVDVTRLLIGGCKMREGHCQVIDEIGFGDDINSSLESETL